MYRDSDWIVDNCKRLILEESGGDAVKARDVVTKLASYDWQQIIHETHQEKIASQMSAMENFLYDLEKGCGFCDDCEYTDRKNYVGGYHHGPMYNKVYAWPHGDYSKEDAFLYTGIVGNTDGKRYCWKCLSGIQEKIENHLFFERRDPYFFHAHEQEAQKIVDIIHLPQSLPSFTPLYRCTSCLRLIPRKSGYSLHYGLYCIHCIEQALEQQFTICQLCNKKTASATNGFCYDCYPISQAYGSQVSTHLGRARAAHTPATLTVTEWATTVDHFQKKCAYCRVRPYQVLEHFIPITLGGGTTVDNCIPACTSCNSRKGMAHPDRLQGKFSSDALNYIRSYLQGDKKQRASYNSTCKALVVIGG